MHKWGLQIHMLQVLVGLKEPPKAVPPLLKPEDLWEPLCGNACAWPHYALSDWGKFPNKDFCTTSVCQDHHETMFMQWPSIHWSWSAPSVSLNTFCCLIWEFSDNHIWLQVAKTTFVLFFLFLKCAPQSLPFPFIGCSFFSLCFVSVCGFLLSPKTLLIFCFFYKAQVPREISPKYFWIPFSGVTRGLVGNSKMPVSWEILESSVNKIFSLRASLTSRAHCAYSSMFVECGNWSWKGIPRTVLEMIFACVVTCVFPACLLTSDWVECQVLGLWCLVNGRSSFSFVTALFTCHPNKAWVFHIISEMKCN